MIILNLEKSNTYFKKILKNYLNMINLPHLECPICHSTDYIRWGFYERNIIYFSNDYISLESSIIKIQRIKCNSCSHTHALIPFGIIPYKQFSDKIISKILIEKLSNSIDSISSKYHIDYNIIKNWIHQFNSFHLSKISIITSIHNIKDMINEFLNNIHYKLDYINHFNCCFMQIKLSSIILNTS